MGKFLFVTSDNEGIEMLEVVPLSDEELKEIRPLVETIAIGKYSTHSDDDYRYASLPGYETFSQFIPDSGVKSITKIEIANVIETLLS